MPRGQRQSNMLPQRQAPQAPQDPLAEVRREMLDFRGRWQVLFASLNLKITATPPQPLTQLETRQIVDFTNRVQLLRTRVLNLPQDEYWAQMNAFSAACSSFLIALNNVTINAANIASLTATDVPALERTYNDLNQVLTAFEPPQTQVSTQPWLPVPPSPQPPTQNQQQNQSPQQNQAPATPAAPNLQAAVQSMKEANYDLVVNDAKKHKGVIDKAELKENDSFFGGIKARMKLVGEWFATTAVGRLAGGLAASQVVAYGAVGALGTVGGFAAAPIVAGVLGAIAAGMTIRQMTKGFRTRQQAIVDMRHLNKRNEKAALKGDNFNAAGELAIMSRNRKRRSLVFAAASLGMAGWHAADPHSFTHAMSSVYDHTLRGPVEFIDSHTQGIQSDIHEWLTGISLPYGSHMPDNDALLQDIWHGQTGDLDQIQFELGQLEGLKLPPGVEMQVWNIHELLARADCIHADGFGLHGEALGFNDHEVGGLIGRADNMIHSLHMQIGHDLSSRIGSMESTIDSILPPYSPDSGLASHMYAEFERAHAALHAGDFREAILAYGQGKHDFDILMGDIGGVHRHVSSGPFMGGVLGPDSNLSPLPSHHSESVDIFQSYLTSDQSHLFGSGHVVVTAGGPMDQSGSDGLARYLLQPEGIINKAAAALHFPLVDGIDASSDARHALAMALAHTDAGQAVLASSQFHPGSHIDVARLFSNPEDIVRHATPDITKYFGGRDNFLKVMQLIHESFSR